MSDKAESGKAPMSKQKKIIIAVVVAILLLNILWTLMQNKVATKVDALMGDMAKLEQRIAQLENAVSSKEELNSMKKLHESQLAETIKAEEARLSSLTTELEDQKAKLDALKAIAAPAE